MIYDYEPEIKIIQFPDGKSAKILETLPTVSTNRVAEWLELPPVRFCVAVHGGASDMSAEYQQKMRSLLSNSLIRFAEDNRALIADGGTDTGIMHVMGDAYRDFGASFPLIGITV
ncbi:MAG TPA: hypothetical protein VJZ27_11765, partial [Aggregatilineales bacterium]|nr:hypothetical protein [Aggregatilineales bacterium]